MRQGNTRLKEQCKYLVRLPHEVFLAPGQRVSDSSRDNNDFSQEELLQQPVDIRYRAKKDPRELKVLDPACGSGHFLLYCFDVLKTIYNEAYDDPDLSPPLKADYPTVDDLKKALPGLIMTRNLHGIDIDLRATQIAALALWLCAQRSYQEMGLTNEDRPKISKSNIVCAEPMPGEKPLLEEFIASLKPRVLGQLVRVVFDKMKLAGEAGSLLRIEDEIIDSVLEAKKQWLAGPQAEQLSLWPEPKRSEVKQLPLFDLSGITEVEFWDEAEARVVDSLRDYAKQAANGRRLLRQLFSDDAAQGFAFVDLCRERFDVVLMNPPFGEASKPSKAYVEAAYPRSKNDIYSAFVERWAGKLVPRGMLGAITSRTGFFLSSFQKWREEALLVEASATVFADLGYGVLDTAMVETAAYCLEAQR